MAYAKAVPINTFSYTPSNFEVSLYNALEKGCNSVKNSLKDGIQKAKNTFNYISEITSPENKNAIVTLYGCGHVFDNLREDAANARGHLLHLIERQHEIYSQLEVKEYVKYLKSKGKKVARIEGYMAANVKKGSTIAGVSTDKFIRHAVPFMGTDYYQKIAEQARKFGTTAEVEKLYTALHETTHMITSLRNMVYHTIYSKYPYAAEKYVEKQVYKYAMKRAREATDEKGRQKWLDVAKIAEKRHENVKKIYKQRRREWREKDKKENVEEKVEDENIKEKDKESKYSKEKEYQEKEAEENPEDNSKEANQDSDLEARVEGDPEAQDPDAEVSEAEACEADGE